MATERIGVDDLRKRFESIGLNVITVARHGQVLSLAAWMPTTKSPSLGRQLFNFRVVDGGVSTTVMREAMDAYKATRATYDWTQDKRYS